MVKNDTALMHCRGDALVSIRRLWYNTRHELPLTRLAGGNRQRKQRRTGSAENAL